MKITAHTRRVSICTMDAAKEIDLMSAPPNA
jgi:hypothetical protein